MSLSASTSSPHLVAHLDLKGVQRRPACVLEALEDLQTLGYRALLVEYEDVFPFRCVRFSEHLEEIWSREFLNTFLAKADSLGIEIIPLQQCLSHLEYAFRSEENRKYCIPYGVPSGLDIERPLARKWLQECLKEVLEAHENSRYIHIGMDEARSLVAHSKKEGKEVLNLFLTYLDELCSLCEQYGKTPLIWSDMLEEHLTPDHLAQLLSLRDRLIIVSWEYMSRGEPQTVVRLSGTRCTQRWLEEPRNAPGEAPLIQDGMLWFEEWPNELQSLVSRYRTSPWAMESFFQAAVWRDLGFKVWGAAGGAITFDRSLLPHYHHRRQNIAAWRAFAAKENFDGVIVTQWARSNSCSVPNLLPDVVWPVLAEAAKGLDHFFKGVEPTRLENLFEKIGRCREGWNIEAHLLMQMAELTPQVQTHREEWETIRLMLEIQQIMKRVDALEELGRCYGGIGRFPSVGWEDQKGQLGQWKERLTVLERQIREHLTKRYFGVALEEWFFKAFGTSFARMALLERTTSEEIARAAQKKETSAQFDREN